MMILPELPKQHKDTEARFGLRFRKWIKAHPLAGTFELKHTKGGASLPFADVKPPQVAWALSVKHHGALIRVQGTRGEPDYVWSQGAAWIVVCYPSCFVVIDIDAWCAEVARAERKSLTEARAREIAVVVV